MPEGWGYDRVGNKCDLGRGRVISQIEILENPGPYPVFSSQTTDEGCMGYLETYDFEGEYATWTTDGANAGTVFYRNGKFNCTNVCGTIQPKKNEPIDLNFFAYHLNRISKRYVSYHGNPKLMNDVMANIAITFPPLQEQHAIAAILGTVDEAIRQTETLITKLRQVKAGMLHDLLTCGLDENGELRDPIRHPEQFKDSQLGRIPKEWEILPLERIANVSSGVTLGNNLQGTGAIELPYLRVANVQDGYLDLSDIKKIHINKKDIERFGLHKGDVLMNEGGDYDKLGRGTVWEGQISPCLHQNHVFRVRPNSALLDSYFLDAVSGSQYGKNYFLLSSKQSTNLASINSTQLNKFPIPCPEIKEQKAIVTILSGQEQAITSEQDVLKKLKTVKEGLMQDLLTGRVRVPESIINNQAEAEADQASFS